MVMTYSIMELRTHRRKAIYTVLPKAGVTSFYDALLHTGALVFQIISSAEWLCLRQYPTQFIKPAE